MRNRLHFLLPFLVFHALPPLPAHSFGQDVCFNSPMPNQGGIRNCVGVEESCRTSNLTPAQAVTCRVQAFQDSLSGLSGSNGIIGGRSLVHSDSTYLMAQLLGYTPWQADQIAIYNEATDQSDYESPANAPYEPLLTNLQDWALKRRTDACVAGILVRNMGGAPASTPCEARDRVIQSPQSVFALGVPALQIPFYSNLGKLIIHEDDQGQVLATDSSFQDFVTPHQRDFAKMGIFLHAYADRVSHHMCTDRSWFQREISGD
jgi:hypothetical protein